MRRGVGVDNQTQNRSGGRGFGYHLTRHFKIRLQQRGKNSEVFKMIQRYGVYNKSTKNITLRRKRALTEIERRKRWLERVPPQQRDLRAKILQRIKDIELSINCAIVVDEGSIITVYNRTRRVYRGGHRRRQYRH